MTVRIPFVPSVLIRDVRRQLADFGRDIAHTSVITTLNTMVRKRYLKRIKDGKAFRFAPKVGQEAIKRNMLGWSFVVYVPFVA